VRVKSLCDLTEYDEKKNQVEPIRISKLLVGSTHSGAILKNSTTSQNGGQQYGQEVFLWGNNAHGQLARADGKRGNSALPLRPRLYQDESKPNEDAFLEENDRLRLLPNRQIKLPNGKSVHVSQDLVLGYGVTLVYDRVLS
jgi:hypothetical protein